MAAGPERAWFGGVAGPAWRAAMEDRQTLCFDRWPPVQGCPVRLAVCLDGLVSGAVVSDLLRAFRGVQDAELKRSERSPRACRVTSSSSRHAASARRWSAACPTQRWHQEPSMPPRRQHHPPHLRPGDHRADPVVAGERIGERIRHEWWRCHQAPTRPTAPGSPGCPDGGGYRVVTVPVDAGRCSLDVRRPYSSQPSWIQAPPASVTMRSSEDQGSPQTKHTPEKRASASSLGSLRPCCHRLSVPMPGASDSLQQTLTPILRLAARGASVVGPGGGQSGSGSSSGEGGHLSSDRGGVMHAGGSTLCTCQQIAETLGDGRTRRDGRSATLRAPSGEAELAETGLATADRQAASRSAA